MISRAPGILLAQIILLFLPTDLHPVRGADPVGSQNLAAESGLPRGNGLAASFTADVGIASHADVIFADNFEHTGARRRRTSVLD